RVSSGRPRGIGASGCVGGVAWRARHRGVESRFARRVGFVSCSPRFARTAMEPDARMVVDPAGRACGQRRVEAPPEKRAHLILVILSEAKDLVYLPVAGHGVRKVD